MADFTDLHACQCIHTSDPSFAYICVIVNTENTKIQTTTQVGAAKIRSDHGHANHYKSWELGTKIRQHPACELTLQELRLRTGGKKRRFASDRLAAVADAPHALASAARPPLDTSALDVDGEACAGTRDVVHLALVPSTPPLAIHNDLEAHRTMRLLSEVRHALRHGPPVAAHFMLFPSIHTFVGAHRDWCEALHAQMGLTTAMSLWVPVSIDVGRAAPCGCSNGALRELVLASSFHKWIDSIL